MHGTLDDILIERRDEGVFESAIFLTEALSEVNEGRSFLEQLSMEEAQELKRASVLRKLSPHESVFIQGEPHDGIFLIEKGQVRTYYAGVSGREITLAYWTPGHFVGGPEIFGGGVHIWSAEAVTDATVRYLPGSSIRHLIERVPSFALCVIDGLVAKGKCYSALVQMLGTRSVVERLAQLLLILGRLQGEQSGSELIIVRRITHEQIANIVGSTRQWVTTALARFQSKGLVTVERNRIVIHRPDLLMSAD